MQKGGTHSLATRARLRAVQLERAKHPDYRDRMRALRAQQPQVPLFERVFMKVRYPDGDDETIRVQCWTWIGALSKRDRGSHRPVIQSAGRGSKIEIVARLICEWFHGPPPTPEHEAGHMCPDGENGLCVSPHHLQWMTRHENMLHLQRELRRRGKRILGPRSKDWTTTSCDLTE